MAHRSRQWEVPQAITAGGAPPRMTLDDMVLASCWGGELGAWAASVLAREDDKTLDEMLGEDKYLPRGVMKDDACYALVSAAGVVWSGQDCNVDVTVEETVDLGEADVAFVARAFQEGYTSVIFSPLVPLAFIAAAPPKTPKAKPVDLPAGAVTAAIVDPVDKNAVLELLAIAPGPTVYRRNDGGWYEDKGWVPVLTAVHPPPMVQLDPSQVDNIASQVDTATKGQPFAELAMKDRALYQPATASSYVRSIQDEAAEQAIKINLRRGMIAVAGREITPKDIKNTEQLKRYWTVGPGAAKIRWGTPGSHTRCVRHLSKYMSPTIVHGYCTNLGQRLGGYGIADHVGTNAKHKAERALKGK